MSLHRWAVRRDVNELGIVRELEARGATVQRVSAPGAPDLLVGYRGQMELVEVKAGRAKLSARQREWWAWWNGPKPTILKTKRDATALLDQLDAEAG